LLLSLSLFEGWLLMVQKNECIDKRRERRCKGRNSRLLEVANHSDGSLLDGSLLSGWQALGHTSAFSDGTPKWWIQTERITPTLLPTSAGQWWIWWPRSGCRSGRCTLTCMKRQTLTWKSLFLRWWVCGRWHHPLPS
jgi:hypothetical protein